MSPAPSAGAARPTLGRRLAEGAAVAACGWLVLGLPPVLAGRMPGHEPHLLTGPWASQYLATWWALGPALVLVGWAAARHTRLDEGVIFLLAGLHYLAYAGIEAARWPEERVVAIAELGVVALQVSPVLCGALLRRWLRPRSATAPPHASADASS